MISELPSCSKVDGLRRQFARPVVPGSGLVKAQAESEGLDKIFSTQAWNGETPAAPCASQ